MTRSVDERVRDVRRLLSAAEAVFQDRARWGSALAATTGLSPEGVELGFASLERDATDDDLRALVAAAGDAPQVHVVLSANVFVAPLRALAVARAAAPRVSVRPSRRDPVLARALVEAAGDGGIVLARERDPAQALASGAGEVHVYGRDETIADVARGVAHRPEVTVRGHGAGLGLAAITRAADVVDAAALVARDVVPFDQRGCLSPRVAVVEGDASRARAFAEALHEQLAAWCIEVPRGALPPQEQAEAKRWRETMAFAGELLEGRDHTVAFASDGTRGTCSTSWWVPPPGRHVLVTADAHFDDLAAQWEQSAPIAPFVVAIGTDDALRLRALLRGPVRLADASSASTASASASASRVRFSALGRMQRPPLDGPVDLRNVERTRRALVAPV